MGRAFELLLPERDDPDAPLRAYNPSYLTPPSSSDIGGTRYLRTNAKFVSDWHAARRAKIAANAAGTREQAQKRAEIIEELRPTPVDPGTPSGGWVAPLPAGITPEAKSTRKRPRANSMRGAVYANSAAKSDPGRPGGSQEAETIAEDTEFRTPTGDKGVSDGEDGTTPCRRRSSCCQNFDDISHAIHASLPGLR